jgi:hypothetical protein
MREFRYEHAVRHSVCAVCGGRQAFKTRERYDAFMASVEEEQRRVKAKQVRK